MNETNLINYKEGYKLVLYDAFYDLFNNHGEYTNVKNNKNICKAFERCNLDNILQDDKIDIYLLYLEIPLLLKPYLYIITIFKIDIYIFIIKKKN